MLFWWFTHSFSHSFFFIFFFRSFGGKQISSIKRNRKHRIKRINFLFLTFFFSGEIVDVIFIVKTFLNCMTNARRLLYGARFCSLSRNIAVVFVSSSHLFLFWTKFPIFMQKKLARIEIFDKLFVLCAFIVFVCFTRL